MIAEPSGHSPASGQSFAEADDIMARRIAVAFTLYGLVATILLAINMPPFQNPDEPAQLLRAAQLADGSLVGTRMPVTDQEGHQFFQGGGLSDPAVRQALLPFDPLVGHPDQKAQRERYTPQVRWSDSRTMTTFPNTAMYPPFFYIPSALGVLLGRMAGATIVQSLVLSRLLTGVATVAVAAVAITSSGAAAIWIFAIMTLPMSLALIASPAPDALILGFSALAVALMLRWQLQPAGPNPGTLAWLTVSLCLVAMARPPYASLMLPLLALPRITWGRRILASAAVIVCVGLWVAITAATTMSNVGAVVHADAARQLTLLVADPFRILPLAVSTLRHYWRGYVASFIGILGWLDTELSPGYRIAAMAMLATAAVAAASGLRRGSGGASSRLLIAIAILIGVASIFVGQYLTWTAPGNDKIEGVQGRYFLPLALPVAALLPSLGGARSARIHQMLVLGVVSFPILSLGVVMRAIVLRYYLD
jgi:uncharacterized membrane protein